MSTSVTVTAARVRRRAAAIVLTDRLAVALLGVIVVALALACWHTFGDLGADTGYDQVAGARVADGQVPYADFVYYYGPLAPALTGLVAWISGGLGPQVWLGLVLAVAIVAATYALARRRTGPLGGLLAAAITAAVAFAPTNFSYVLAHTISAPLGILLCLGVLMAMERFLAEDRIAWLWWAGAAAGFVALTRPEFEAAAVLALGLWLVLRRRSCARLRREAAALAIPAIGIPAVVYGAFMLVVSPGTLLFENLYPRDQLREAGNAVLEVHAPFTPRSFAELAGRLAVYAIGIAAIVVLARLIGSGGRARAAGLAIVSAAGFAAIVAASVRPEAVRHGLQFAYGWIPAGALVALIVMLWRRGRTGHWPAAAQADLLLVAILGVLAWKTYAAFFVHSPKAQPAVYAVPFAAVFLARLHLGRYLPSRTSRVLGAMWLAFLAVVGIGLTVKDARSESAFVRGPGGEMAVAPADAPAYQGALDLVASATRPGEPVLFAPQLSALSVLAERSSPLRELSLLPGALPSPADESAAIGRLEAAGVRMAVIDRRRFTEYGHSAFGESFDRELAAWIHQNFLHTATLTGGRGSRTLDVWQRRTS